VELCTHQLLHDHYLLLPGRLPLSEKEVDLKWAKIWCGEYRSAVRGSTYTPPLSQPLSVDQWPVSLQHRALKLKAGYQPLLPPHPLRPPPRPSLSHAPLYQADCPFSERGVDLKCKSRTSVVSQWPVSLQPGDLD
jgi:hypothetical protein